MSLNVFERTEHVTCLLNVRFANAVLRRPSNAMRTALGRPHRFVTAQEFTFCINFDGRWEPTLTDQVHRERQGVQLRLSKRHRKG